MLIVRLVVAVCAGALMITSVVVGAAPQVWNALHAHDEEPVSLVAYGGLTSRTRILDANGQQIGVFEFENSQPISIDQVPEHLVCRLLLEKKKSN